MSYNLYLSSITKALGERVLDKVSDAEARSVLEAAIRALAGLADAFDPDRDLAYPLRNVPPPVAMPDAPPENAAVRPRTAGGVAAGAALLARGDWLNAGAGDAVALVDWERKLMASAIGAMRTAEKPPVRQDADGEANPLLIARETVEAYFQARFGPQARVSGYRQAVGGRSRQTVLFTLDGVPDLPCELVIQRDHPAGISPYGVIDEYPVLELLARSALKSPRPVLLERDRGPLGAPFAVAERRPGSVAGPDYFDPPRGRGLGRQIGEQLGILHAADCSSLKGTLRETLAAGDSWAGELDRLESRWEGLRHFPSVSASAAFAWMKRHVGQIGDELAIIHNDAAFHNVLVDDGMISALLDWELVHLGHPAEDLGYCRPFIQEMDEWAEFLEAYVAAGGQRFSPEVIDYFSLRALLNLMVLMQDGGRRMFETKVTDDINLAEVGASFMPKVMLRLANVMTAVLDGTEC